MAAGISVLIPAVENTSGPARCSLWAEGLLRAVEYLEGCGVDWEILVFGRADEVEALRARGLVKEPGFFRWVEGARAFQAALEAARHPIVVLFPADGGIPLKENELLGAELQKGFDIVWGSRFKTGQSIAREGTSKARLLAGWARGAAARLAGAPVGDSASGFAVFRRDLGGHASEWALGVDAKRVSASDLARAAKMGLKFKEVGIMWAHR